MRPPVRGYGYEGGFSTENGCRPARHRTLAREDMRRAARKRQRQQQRRSDAASVEWDE